jgi:activator of 2-hydroxyglutaryl-CoA dehydratase
MIYAGIDAGSRTIKIVLIDSGNMQVLAKALTDQGVEQDKLTSELFENVLKTTALTKKMLLQSWQPATEETQLVSLIQR